MASQTAGIQQLLSAEKRAAEKINEARKRKAKRLKQAKEEAQAEVERYRGERDSQFKAFEAEHLGSRDDVQSRIDQSTAAELIKMKSLTEQNKEKVITTLLQLVNDINPEVHKNFKN